MSIISKIEFPESLRSKLEKYYHSYYQIELGHKNWKSMVENRLDEDKQIGERSVQWVKEWTPVQIPQANTLIVGAGTGAETVAFSKAEANVTALEPSSEACDIIQEKLKYYGIEGVKVDCGCAEKMSYTDNTFDLIVCITVLEHTRNPSECIDEMIRVLKPKTWLFLMTPEYFGIYEQHYKRILPLFLPKWMIKWYLRYLGRPDQFIDTLRFVTYGSLKKKFSTLKVNAFYRHYPWPEEWINGSNRMGHQCYQFGKLFGTQRDQFWLIQKQ